jgi:SAM-dependent methyltransferase
MVTNIPNVICPKCKNALNINIFNDNLNLINNKYIQCDRCTQRIAIIDGCIDFALDQKNASEQNFYQNIYSKKCHNSRLKYDLRENASFEYFFNIWHDRSAPERGLFLEELLKKEIKNKTVLLLGNGSSLKELLLLKYGCNVIYSDLSLNAILNAKNSINLETYKDKLKFSTIDANSIPFANESIDIVIGYAFVHHLDDIDIFFKEISRILKPGGSCLFLDNSYSGKWRKIKIGLFPLIKFVGNRHGGISPQDERFMRKSGFKYEEIEKVAEDNELIRLIYLRSCFLSYFFRLGINMLFGYNIFTSKICNLLVPGLFYIDNQLEKKFVSIYENTLFLIWGMEKSDKKNRLISNT